MGFTKFLRIIKFGMKNKCKKCGQKYRHYITPDGLNFCIHEIGMYTKELYLTFCTNQDCPDFEVLKIINLKENGIF